MSGVPCFAFLMNLSVSHSTKRVGLLRCPYILPAVMSCQLLLEFSFTWSCDGSKKADESLVMWKSSLSFPDKRGLGDSQGPWTPLWDPLLDTVPGCEHVMTFFSILVLMDVCAVSSLGPLWMNLLWTFLHASFDRNHTPPPPEDTGHIFRSGIMAS